MSSDCSVLFKCMACGFPKGPFKRLFLFVLLETHSIPLLLHCLCRQVIVRR